MVYYFSNMISALINPSYSADIGLSQLNWQLKMQNSSMDCLVPRFDSVGMSFPGMNISMPVGLDPNACADSCFQAWNQYQQQMNDKFQEYLQSGQFPQGGYGNYSGFGGVGNYGGYPSPAQIWGYNPTQQNVGEQSSSQSGNSSMTPEGRQKKEKYDIIKPILTKIKDSLPKGDSLKAEIETALNKSGNSDEKFEALNEVMQKVASNENKKYLKSALIKNKSDILNDLTNAGYDLTNDNLGKNSTDLKHKIENLKNYIADKNANGAVTIINGQEKDIMKIISTWNDEYSGEHIINKIIKNADYKNPTIPLGLVKNLVTSLNHYVVDLSSKYDDKGTFTKLLDKKDKLDKQLSKIIETKDGKYPNFKKTELQKLATLFDELYTTIRLTEAQLINNKIKEEYQGINEMLGGVLEDDFVVKNTKEDLKRENCDTNIELDKIDAPELRHSEIKENGKEDKKDDVTPSTKTDVTTETKNDSKVEADTSSKTKSTTTNKNNEDDAEEQIIAKDLGRDFRAELYCSKTDASKINEYIDKFCEFESKDIVDFVNGYNEQKSWMCQWNSKLCAMISTQSDSEISEEDKIEILIKISNQFVKVIDELLKNPKCSKYKDDLKEFKRTFKIISDESNKNPEKWQSKIGFWEHRTWSFTGNPMTGVSNYMDRTIGKICDIYKKSN